MKFKIDTTLDRMRTGVVKTKHGKFNTPVFIPVATLASVRGLDNRDLKEMGAEVLLANTYHLHLRPGDEVIKKLGGLHKFMNIDLPIVTDSGGFQAFSLGFGMEHGVGKIANNIFLEGLKDIDFKGEKWAYVDDRGVRFKNHISGEIVELTPRKSMEIQSNLGSDIIFAFDECTSPLSDKKYTEIALERTHRWAEECLQYYNKKQAIFGIVQGGEYRDLRERSAKFMAERDFDGFGIGGSLGKSKRDMHNILEWVIPLLPEEKPRHLLGIGAVEDLFNCIERGVDMFDCVAPTRWARRGHLYISPEEGGKPENKFRIHIKNAKFRFDTNPVDRSCDCFVCQEYSRAYLRHLYVSNELTYFRLASYHNVYFIIRLVEKIRDSIESGAFYELKKRWLGYQ
ncbi:tRNA-guanine transglycosylase [Archaeoglobus sulfaticallidus PM70-1]|uniref:tRNA-guanine transglycosylase n=1 Tax=Archaeoglobus sulfaticallidus PM70-1 TaxID=387631 RepID=N0BB25_9EURY|nr:tRNA guanosine(34) transglycosylase Tgt [Archaeoglobus sulfaticallidus]AGK60809.1 tRNA-guanine transglycosylase [Archaeoglobus sulfaticallidus PM70-1]